MLTRSPAVVSRFSDENRLYLPKIVFIRRAVAFFRRADAFIRRVDVFFGRKSCFSAVLSRSSRVLSRFSGENHVHPVCCLVFQEKTAFIRRAVVFFGRKTRSSGVLSRFSDENRVHPACCRVFHSKIAFIRRKTRSSPENRVLPMKIAFFCGKQRQVLPARPNPDDHQWQRTIIAGFLGESQPPD